MIVLSCGHEVDDFDHVHDVMYKSTDRTGEKAISYAVVCGSCEDSHRQQGYLFENEEQAWEWMKTESW